MRAAGPGRVFRSDRGRHYSGHEFQSALQGYKMKSAMGRQGDYWLGLRSAKDGPSEWSRIYNRSEQRRVSCH